MNGMQIAAMAIRKEDALTHYSRGVLLMARLWELSAKMGIECKVGHS